MTIKVICKKIYIMYGQKINSIKSLSHFALLSALSQVNKRFYDRINNIYRQTAKLSSLSTYLRRGEKQRK